MNIKQVMALRRFDTMRQRRLKTNPGDPMQRRLVSLVEIQVQQTNRNLELGEKMYRTAKTQAFALDTMADTLASFLELAKKSGV